MKEIVVPAGERTRVLNRFSSSIPQTFLLDIEPLSGPATVSGTIEVQGSRWLFRREPVVMDLLPSMAVEKGFWDTIFSVHITSDRDVRVTIRTGGML